MLRKSFAAQNKWQIYSRHVDVVVNSWENLLRQLVAPQLAKSCFCYTCWY